MVCKNSWFFPIFSIRSTAGKTNKMDHSALHLQSVSLTSALLWALGCASKKTSALAKYQPDLCFALSVRLCAVHHRKPLQLQITSLTSALLWALGCADWVHASQATRIISLCYCVIQSFDFSSALLLWVIIIALHMTLKMVTFLCCTPPLQKHNHMP